MTSERWGWPIYADSPINEYCSASTVVVLFVVPKFVTVRAMGLIPNYKPSTPNQAQPLWSLFCVYVISWVGSRNEENGLNLYVRSWQMVTCNEICSQVCFDQAGLEHVGSARNHARD